MWVSCRTVSPYGRFLMWNKDPRDKTRIVVKIRIMNVDALPISIVVLRNLDDVGYGDTWTCPTYILSRELIGQQGGDEDPLPPNGGNSHPLPHVHGGFWHDEVLGNIPIDQVVINPHNENLGAPYEDVHAADDVYQNNHNVAVDQNAVVDNLNSSVTAHVPVVDDNANLITGNVQISDMQDNNNVAQGNDLFECTGPDFISLEHESNQQNSHNAASPAFISNNADMNYNDVPSTSNAQLVQTCNISVDGVTEHIAVLQDLIGSLVTNAHDIIPKLGGSKIINAKCNVVDVEGSHGTNKRYYLQI